LGPSYPPPTDAKPAGDKTDNKAAVPVPDDEATVPDTAKVGLFITSLYDINLAEESYNIDGWLWYLYTADSLNVLDYSEISNAKEFEYLMHTTETKGGIYWATQKFRATVKQKWALENFPFDQQNLELYLEEGDKDITDLIYLADAQNSAIDTSVQLGGWSLVGFKVESRPRTYNTTYGDPELTGGGQSEYSRIVATITIQRNAGNIFLKLFTGVYVAFFIAWLVFFIDPLHVDPRFGLCVGGLFAAVGNKYIVDGILPESATFTLVDKIHDLTFAFILQMIALSVISLYFRQLDENSKRYKMIDRTGLVASFLLYISLNVLFIYQAMP